MAIAALMLTHGISKTALFNETPVVTMLVAVFIVHSGDPFAKQEVGLHYLLVYMILLLTGSGKYSLDRLITLMGR